MSFFFWHHQLPTQALQLYETQGVYTLNLPAGQDIRLSVQRGTLWLTQTHQLEDWLLTAGQEHLCSGPVQLTLGALGHATCALSVQRLPLAPRARHWRKRFGMLQLIQQ